MEIGETAALIGAVGSLSVGGAALLNAIKSRSTRQPPDDPPDPPQPQPPH
jgi:hypothetical protein